jgi:hypothetical protein
VGNTRGQLLRDKPALIQSAADAQRVVASLCPSGAPDMRGVDANSAPVLDSRACAALINSQTCCAKTEIRALVTLSSTFPTASTTSKAPILKTQCPSMLPSKVTMLCTGF